MTRVKFNHLVSASVSELMLDMWSLKEHKELPPPTAITTTATTTNNQVLPQDYQVTYACDVVVSTIDPLSAPPDPVYYHVRFSSTMV